MIDDPLLGQQLANFLIERAIGRGGMAQVYYGQDVKLQRPVAIKVIDARYRGNPAYAKRFVREAQAIARWRHENIIQIHYADDQDGLYYFVMEYIDGLDLGQLISQHAAKNELIPQPEVVRIGRAVAGALDYAHRQGVIHRDVKPSNVMIAQDGRVVLTDFGLAMAVEQGSMGEVFGSANYVAPEQARHSGGAVPQSDLYSLGIMLYEMLTGRVPFDDPSSTAVAIQHLTLPPPPPREINPNLNQATEAVLLKALSKSPEERYQTGNALMDALAGAVLENPALSAEQVDAPPTLPELLPLPVVTPNSSLDASQASSAAKLALSASEGQAKTQHMTSPPPGVVPAAPTNRRLIYAVTGVGLAAIVILLLILSIVLFLRLRSSGEAITGQGLPPAENEAVAAASNTSGEPAALVPTESPPAPTEAPTLTPTQAPAAALPTETPAPIVESPASYDLLIAKSGDDSLFVINLTPGPFPLAQLRLVSEKGDLAGSAWGLDILENGACVTAWKDGGKPKRPDVTCKEVGQPLIFWGKNRFWGETFAVFYGEVLIGICKKDEELCTFNTASTFNWPVEEDKKNKEEKESDD